MLVRKGASLDCFGCKGAASAAALYCVTGNVHVQCTVAGQRFWWGVVIMVPASVCVGFHSCMELVCDVRFHSRICFSLCSICNDCGQSNKSIILLN